MPTPFQQWVANKRNVCNNVVCQVPESQDNMSPQTHAFALSGNGDSGTRAQQLEGFFAFAYCPSMTKQRTMTRWPARKVFANRFNPGSVSGLYARDRNSHGHKVENKDHDD